MGLEPTTATLARWRSTTELRSLLKLFHTIPHPPPHATLFFAHCFHPQIPLHNPTTRPPTQTAAPYPRDAGIWFNHGGFFHRSTAMPGPCSAWLSWSISSDPVVEQSRLHPRNPPRPPCFHDHGRPFPPHTIPSKTVHSFPCFPFRPPPALSSLIHPGKRRRRKDLHGEE